MHIQKLPLNQNRKSLLGMPVTPSSPFPREYASHLSHWCSAPPSLDLRVEAQPCSSTAGQLRDGLKTIKLAVLGELGRTKG